ncbi:MAG: pentapeptide repeat-containing protein, partial [Alphaproteobacteria bacterium]|nr:pentapeptide repeat-containing protein [Alphaproteobacteria bacterium]
VFKEADLRRARFFRAQLEGADFTGARLRQADFFDADLSGAVWTDGKHVCAQGSIGQCR